MLPSIKIEPKDIDWTDLPHRYFHPGELERLVALIAPLAPRRMIEFGVNSGRTAKALLREVPSLEQYIGVDVLPGYVTAMRVQRREVPHEAGALALGDSRLDLRVSRRGSFDLRPEDLPELDVAFIDGDHSRAGVENDTKLARARVRKGGLIIWHDYHQKPVVEVAATLHDYAAAGHSIFHVEDTWLAFERVA